jgi:hypothetical protein
MEKLIEPPVSDGPPRSRATDPKDTLGCKCGVSRGLHSLCFLCHMTWFRWRFDQVWNVDSARLASIRHDIVSNYLEQVYWANPLPAPKNCSPNLLEKLRSTGAFASTSQGTANHVILNEVRAYPLSNIDLADIHSTSVSSRSRHNG